MHLGEGLAIFAPMITRRQSLIASLFAIVTLISGANSRAADPASLKVGEFTFKAVDKWKTKEVPRMMSQGGFTLLTSDGTKTIDADFYHFGAGQGGDLEANVNRWKGQFQPGADGKEVKLERTEVLYGKRKVTYVVITGTFLSGSPMGAKTPQPGSAMIGAILESGEGSVFVKFTGPEKEITASKETFKKLIGTAYPDAPTEAKPAAADEKNK